MHKKQILVLSIIAAGIAIELILMATFEIGRGNSQRALSTQSLINPVGDIQNNAIGLQGEATSQFAEGMPITDEDHLPGSEPDFLNEPTPVFGFGDGSAEGTPLADTTFTFGDDTSAPDFTDQGGDGGYFPDNDYPAPPVLPPVDPEMFPTDVPAFGEATATPITPTNVPAPSATNPAAPTAAAPTEVPTYAWPTDAVPTATMPAVTLPTAAVPTAAVATIAPQATQPLPQPTATQGPDLARPTRAPTATPPSEQPTPTAAAFSGLVSVRAGDAPRLDGSDGDAAWSAASAVNISTHNGANQSASQVTVRSLYDSENVYFLLTWADPTQSFLRAPWEKQADGSWKILTSPERVHNDENLFAEDKISFFWAAQDLPTFAEQGCGIACHSGENADVKPYGNMYTPSDGSRGDIWQWKSVRGVGQLDDQYLDATRYSSDTPSAGFHPDSSDGGGYQINRNEAKDAPAYMPPGGGEKNGAPGYILENEKAPFDDSLFKAGERVPGVITAPFSGDRGDISAAWRYKDGRWTLELRRRLQTGSSRDVQFNDIDKTYFFALATFDNTEVRHAMQQAATAFRFVK